MHIPTPPADLHSVVRFALAEDIGSGDITAALIPAANTVRAKIISRDQGILCGGPWVDEIFNQLDPSLQINWETEEGSSFEQGQVLAIVSGSARHILSAERTLLNFLQTLSATATQSHRYASLVAHTHVRLLDTRKTLPGLRSAQKYAVRVGGCYNHRMGLFDAFLIKENHISACGGIDKTIKTARSLYPDKPVEIEVQNLAELEQALSAAADIIMLDNFGISQIKKAVAINGGRSKLEASGGIGGNTLVNIAETGVDYISIGSLTKDCKAIDLSLLVE
ncbi:MAG TPA: carboxylating nicotinate-nucleotide diphosphorylase [Gammaproteobacteria bacterium]|jgi:nicotinate-nucleotide pyrophosphorylase (carboxylating)|nr:carboxylating nicotinate-nucleotide diphosphorylase [Gammaproteobacteria bacterium]HIF86200.1 carboxylating nicotinate-nucleotide diphosphorylase [Gammaproteobacteria bacterium]HIL62560.1 carboxylating nicotinate-nucleotide diphosphorylase [Porticoccaceae bacterium]HIN89572.1 carboxylating nicotinate-nucleotide diphosphorylase [Porticoccaceae bacterium]|tara:strand:- start:5967 stop:6803 length:837 start_codon:yes stop_codon:yes gene_type:complete